jgi:hypothetical protein
MNEDDGTGIGVDCSAPMPVFRSLPIRMIFQNHRYRINAQNPCQLSAPRADSSELH